MSYFIAFDEAVEEYFLAIEWMTEEDLARLTEGVESDLGAHADHFIGPAALSLESLHFRYKYLHITRGPMFLFTFTVDGTNAEAGVLRIVYAEHREVDRREVSDDIP